MSFHPTPAVSVCLCTYNRSHLLKQTLESVYQQMSSFGESFEIVVVDDGSTDKTTEVLAWAESTSPVPFRFLTQQNKGVAAARNACVREARGTWIAFLDDDQIAAPRWLMELHRTALETGGDCIGGPSLLLLPNDVSSNPKPTVRRLLGENPFFAREPRWFSRFDPRRKAEFVPGTGNVMVRRSLFSDIGGFNESSSIGEDAEFFRKAIRAKARIVASPSAVMYQVVPAARLQSQYLFPLVEKCASHRAGLDRSELPKSKLALLFVLRLGHLAAVVLPSLGFALAFRQPELALARHCSLRYFLAYAGALCPSGELSHPGRTN
ncbi:MAG: glycosyltransferase family 2 protein [Bdellovibrionales bacterium]|nr:glycosyltransferase family 2 protein [Bdellovibrionales bacterium]